MKMSWVASVVIDEVGKPLRDKPLLGALDLLHGLMFVAWRASKANFSRKQTFRPPRLVQRGMRKEKRLRPRRHVPRTPLRSWNSIAVFILGAIALGLPVIQGTPAPASSSVGVEDRPNVLIVMTDDQRNELTSMPKTRKLIKNKGRSYTNAFAATPNCCPSRASLFSGRYSHNHGVKNNRLAYQLDHSTTLQRYLDDEGYRTGIFGKFLNEWDVKDDPPHFDRFSIYKHDSGIYRNGTYSVNGKMTKIEQYGTNYLSDKAVDFLKDSERNDSNPWLMYVTPNAPHPPAQPAREYKNANVPGWTGNPAVFEQDLSDKHRYVRAQKVSFAEASHFREKQLRTLMSVDEMVGRLSKKLRQLDETQDTIVIFTSDNGYFWGEHGVEDKWLPYEQAVHIPLIVRWPGELSAGSQDTRLVVNVDIAPTILDALGIEQDAEVPMDGMSLLDNSWNRSEILLEYGLRQPAEEDIEVPTWKGLRSKTAAYTEYYNKAGDVIFREYYDLEGDPWELDNILKDGNPTNDAPAEAMAAELATVKDCEGSACP